MFEVGFSELLLIAALALVVLGPETSPAGRAAGRPLGRPGPLDGPPVPRAARRGSERRPAARRTAPPLHPAAADAASAASPLPAAEPDNTACHVPERSLRPRRAARAQRTDDHVQPRRTATAYRRAAARTRAAPPSAPPGERRPRETCRYPIGIMSEEPEKLAEGTLISHLLELRDRLIRALAVRAGDVHSVRDLLERDLHVRREAAARQAARRRAR